MIEKENIIPHSHTINKEKRNSQYGHKSFVVWFTGLSGSGKSTIADHTEQLLFKHGVRTYLLDGDNVRSGLNKGLGFNEVDRYENLRRVGEVAKLFVDAGVVVLCAFVSPRARDRKLVREIVDDENFVEIFVNTPLSECERRDVKGLYKKARAGQIKNFTGVDSPYENPIDPDIEIDTEKFSVENSANIVFNYLHKLL